MKIEVTKSPNLSTKKLQNFLTHQKIMMHAFSAKNIVFLTPKIFTKRPLGGHLVPRDVLLLIISLKKKRNVKEKS